MNVYTLVLFVHISALLVAIATSALIHFAESRMLSARTVGELRQWGALLTRLAKVFPLALLTLVASGAYMVSSGWAWNIGWIDAALGGVTLLFVGGIFLDNRGKALGYTLGGDPLDPVSAASTRLLHDPITRSVSYAATSLSFGIVFIMVNKPSLVGAIVTFVVAIAIGVVVAIPRWRGEHGSSLATALTDRQD
jgi:hypothetical protein